MRIEMSDHSFGKWLSALALGLLALSTASVSAQPFTAWPVGPEPEPNPNPPFYWIGTTIWGGSAGTISPAPGAPAQGGCFYHTCSTMTVGDGYGINLVGDTQIGDGATVNYRVEVAFPSANCSSDVVMSLRSTNSFIGGVAHGTASACTAFQAAYAEGQWSTVCYLTNHVGVLHPNIEFRYVAGVNGRIYADCVRYTGVGFSTTISPARISRFCGTSLQYTNGSGNCFVLLQSSDPTAPLATWQRADTNSASSGTFTIPAVGTGGAMFYAIQSE
jgi:hypothetical protein